MKPDHEAAMKIALGVQETIAMGLGKFTNPDQPALVALATAFLELKAQLDAERKAREKAETTRDMAIERIAPLEAAMPQPCCQDYKNCTRGRCVPRLEYLLNEAIEGNMALVDENMNAEKERIIDCCAVHDFSEAMQAKMNKSRAKGRSGWHDPYQCTVSSLAKLLREHLDKGDYVDVGNFAMMLWHRTGKVK